MPRTATAKTIRNAKHITSAHSKLGRRIAAKPHSYSDDSNEMAYNCTIQMIAMMRTLICMVGAASLGLSVLVYEDEESRIQSRLEDYWIRLDDIRVRSFQTEDFLLTRLALRFNQILDSLFGRKVFSLRSIVTSVSQSIITCLTTLLVYSHLAHLSSSRGVETTLWAMVAWEIMCITLSRRSIRIAVVCWTLPFVPVVIYLLIASSRPNKHAGDLLILFGALTISLISDFTVIAMSRLLIRYAANSESALKLFVAGLFAVIMLAAITMVPLFIAENRSFDQHLHADRRVIYRISQGVAVLNLSDTLLMVILLLLICFLFVNHALWPIIQRPLYSAQRAGVTTNRKLAMSIGLTMLSIGLGLTPIMQGVKKMLGM